MNPFLRKLLLLLLIVVSTSEARAQLMTFGELSFSGGTGLGAKFGGEFGCTAHGMAGIQYGIVAVNLGGGFVRLPRHFEEHIPVLETLYIDFPAGLAIRMPFSRSAMLVVGSDVCGFIGRGRLFYEPHAGLLFQGRQLYRGFFFKAVIFPEDPSAGYIGVGLKMQISS